MIYDLKEAKEKMGISHASYLRKLINNGRLKARKIGNAWAVEQEEIDKYVASRGTKTL